MTRVPNVQDAAAVRADYPIPPQAGIYYFEVEIVSKGQKGYIGIGFSSRAVDLERLPGTLYGCDTFVGYLTLMTAIQAGTPSPTVITETMAKPSLAQGRVKHIPNVLGLATS